MVARKCALGIHRGNCSNLFRHGAKFVTQLRGVGFQCCNNARVHQLAAVALGRAMTFGKHGKQAARTPAQLLDANQLVVYTAVAARTQLCFCRHHRGVQRRQLGAQTALGFFASQLVGCKVLQARREALNFATSQEHLQRTHLGNQCTVTTRCIGLSF